MSAAKSPRAVAAIELGLQHELYIGNLDARRDWGDARDFVKGMWLILQQSEPDDYVLATGESHSVREFIELAFAQVGRKIVWKGRGEDEVGLDAATGQVLIKVDRRYFRPTEVDTLLGDASKARLELGWKPETSFADLVAQMVTADLKVVPTELRRKQRTAY